MMALRLCCAKFAGLLLTISLSVTPTCASNDPPNVLIILADDVGQGEVPGYWDTGKVKMPNLEKMVKKGTVFTDAHSEPLCAPSRYLLLSGNYPHRGMRYGGTWVPNYTGPQFLQNQKSIAEVLRTRGGYNTFVTGKWHLGGVIPTKQDFTPKSVNMSNIITNDNHNWKKPMLGGPQDLGFGSSVITTGGIQSPPYAWMTDGSYNLDKDLKNWQKGRYSMPHGTSTILKAGDGESVWDSSAYNMRLVNETEKFLDKHLKKNKRTKKKQPFFAYVPLGGVHIPHTPPTKYRDGTSVAGEYPTEHMDLLGEMDKVVGSLVRALVTRRLLRDTLIIFSSDNGGLGKSTGSQDHDHYGSGPLKGKKGSIHEGGHRVPLIMRWDGGMVPANERRDNLMSLADIYRTITDIAGVKVPSNQAIDSISFAKHIKDKSFTQDMRTYLGHWNIDHGKLLEEAVRYKHYKLIRDIKTGKMTLYNLKNDIKEENGKVFSKKSRPWVKKTVRKMYKKLKTFGMCYDNPRSSMNMPRTCAYFEEEKTRCVKSQKALYHCSYTCAATFGNQRICKNHH